MSRPAAAGFDYRDELLYVIMEDRTVFIYTAREDDPRKGWDRLPRWHETADSEASGSSSGNRSVGSPESARNAPVP